ncbi:MAG: citrate synthase, partial [Candidatus Limiplasma sp.]|nr:citrate synthase [Candidatus Limiplasma sp.]
MYAAGREQDVIQGASIDQELYQTYGVKRGLRDKNGKGVLAGLTGISEIQSYREE